MFLHWNDLIKAEKEQAEISFLSIMEDIQFDSDNEWNKDYHEKLKVDRKYRIAELKEKSFIRDKSGYIFVNM